MVTAMRKARNRCPLKRVLGFVARRGEIFTYFRMDFESYKWFKT